MLEKPAKVRVAGAGPPLPGRTLPGLRGAGWFQEGLPGYVTDLVGCSIVLQFCDFLYVHPLTFP